MEIRGVTVTLIQLTITSTTVVDGFGKPIPTEVPVSVDDVLYAPTTVDDVIDTTRLEGTKELYTLAIPKTDNHVWLHNKVQFMGKTWYCYAESQGIDTLVPTKWNKKVLVERYEG